jgi:hypothetical protein
MFNRQQMPTIRALCPPRPCPDAGTPAHPSLETASPRKVTTPTHDAQRAKDWLRPAKPAARARVPDNLGMRRQCHITLDVTGAQGIGAPGARTPLSVRVDGLVRPHLSFLFA